MRLKYENYFLSRILFQTLKQQSNYKSFIAKTVEIDGSISKLKATSPV